MTDWKDSDQAFEEAIASGRLSADSKDDNYAGRYVYMGPGVDLNGESGDTFKHYRTRQYSDAVQAAMGENKSSDLAEWVCPRCGHRNSDKNKVCKGMEMGDGTCRHPKTR